MLSIIDAVITCLPSQLSIESTLTHLLSQSTVIDCQCQPIDGQLQRISAIVVAVIDCHAMCAILFVPIIDISCAVERNELVSPYTCSR